MTNNNRMRLKSDLRGSIALEFALTIPIILIILVGEFLFTDLMFCSMKATLLAHTFANLESSSTTGYVTQSSVQDDFTYGTPFIISPLKAASTKLRVSGVWTDGSGNGVVDWSQAYNDAPYAKGQVVSLNLTTPTKQGVFFVLTEASYKPSLNGVFGLKLPSQISDSVLTFPRNFAHISCSDCS